MLHEAVVYLACCHLIQKTKAAPEHCATSVVLWVAAARMERGHVFVEVEAVDTGVLQALAAAIGASALVVEVSAE